MCFEIGDRFIPEKFCCCCKLKYGACIIATIGTIVCSFEVYEISINISHGVCSGTLISDLVLQLLGLVTAVLLMYGALISKWMYLLPWLIRLPVGLIITVVDSVNYGIILDEAEKANVATLIIALIITVCLSIYFWLCIYGLLLEIISSNPMNGDEEALLGVTEDSFVNTTQVLQSSTPRGYMSI